MKYLLLLLIPLISVSLCTQFPDIFSIPLVPEVASLGTGSQDIFISVESPSSQISAGMAAQVYFQLANMQNYSLSNVRLEVYDNSCFSDGISVKSDCGAGGTLRKNETCTWSWRWASSPSPIDRTCTVRYKVSYSASNSILQDIAVMSESEYQSRGGVGSLQGIVLSATPAKGPLNYYLTFSEAQPFIGGRSGYTMYVNYENRGDGYFDDLTGDITLLPPSTMTIYDCKDYTGNVLNKNPVFIRGKALRSECFFSTSDVSALSISAMEVRAEYTYNLYKTFTILVKGSRLS